MTRQTSKDAYKAIQGIIGGLQWEVYDFLYQYGPATQMEACRKMPGATFKQDRSYMPRFAELEKMGVIQTTGIRICQVTGREVMEWDVTSNLPNKIKKVEKDIRYLCFTCNTHYSGEVSSHPSRDFPLLRCTGELKKYKGAT